MKTVIAVSSVATTIAAKDGIDRPGICLEPVSMSARDYLDSTVHQPATAWEQVQNCTAALRRAFRAARCVGHSSGDTSAQIASMIRLVDTVCPALSDSTPKITCFRWPVGCS